MRYCLDNAAALRLVFCAMCALAGPSSAQDSAPQPVVETDSASQPARETPATPPVVETDSTSQPDLETPATPPTAGDVTPEPGTGPPGESGADDAQDAPEDTAQDTSQDTVAAQEPARPRAQSIDLEQPVAPAPEITPDGTVIITKEATAAGSEAAASTGDEQGATGEPLVLLGVEVPPATSTRLAWTPTESFEGVGISTPVLVVNGRNAGPTLCLSAAVHGDELNGVEIVRRVMYDLDPEKLSGAVVGVPIVNLQGFHRSSRYLPDRRDLNRFFPGNPNGSSASRIAYSFFNEIIRHCDALVDLHTGSFHRTNLPQLRADLTHPDVMELSRLFGATVTLHSYDQPGTLRQAAVEAGVPAVTLETGEPMRLQEEAVEHGVDGVRSLLHNMEMYKSLRFWKNDEPIFYQSVWVRANSGGILLNKVDLGDAVDKGKTLGTVTDPITNVSSDIKAPYDGRVLGMALNQVVLPGFAAYRIGVRSSKEEITDSPESVADDEETETSDSDPATSEDEDEEEDDLAFFPDDYEAEVSE